MIFASYDDRGCNFDISITQIVDSAGSLLKQTLIAGQTEKLLWEPGTRQRPKSSARSATEDNGGDIDHVFSILCLSGVSTSDGGASISKLVVLLMMAELNNLPMDDHSRLNQKKIDW